MSSSRNLSLAAVLCLVASLSAAQVIDCSIPRGQQPVGYVRSAAHTTYVQGLVSAIAPINGKVGIVGIGFSNISKMLPTLFSLIGRSDREAPGVVTVGAAQSGVTTEYWADPGHPAWAQADILVGKAKMTPSQVQVVIAGFASEKQQAVPLVAQQFRSVADTIAARWPNVRLVVWITMNGTPGLKPYAQNLYLTQPVNTALAADLVEQPSFWPAGQAHILIDSFADGVTPNPWTASGRYPGGVAWRPVDYDTDCVHQSDLGAQRFGWTLFERLEADPVFAGWLFQ